MKKLCLMRHAKSSWQDSGLSDFERPLNKRGASDAPMMGKRLAALGLKADQIVSSPATRAQTTARIIARQIAYADKDIVLDEQLYLADTEILYEVIGGLNNSHNTIMLFGHNPGFTQLANDIGNLDIDNMPTCGIAVFDLNIDSWSGVAPDSGKLVLFDYPKNDH